MPALKHPTFWAPRPVEPTAETMKWLAAPDAYKKGRECYRRGCVVSASMRRNLVWATVNDGGATYRVVAPLGYNAPYCSCPLGDTIQSCSHGVAVLSYASKMFNELIRGDPWKGVEELVASLPLDALKEFAGVAQAGADMPGAHGPGGGKRRLPVFRAPASEAADAEVRASVAELLKSGESRSLFADRFGEPDLPDRRECRAEMAYMFCAASHMFDAPRVGLADFFRAAKAREGRGDICEAILTYREISEAVMIDGSNADDEDGYYSSAFGRALDRMAVCIRRHLREPAQRLPHIEYLHRRLVDDVYWWFHEKYQNAIFKICTRREDLEYLEKLHHAHLEKARPAGADTYHQKRMLETREAILSGLAKSVRTGEPATQ